MIARLQKARKTAILGLSLEGSRVTVVPVRRTNGSAEAGSPVTLDLGGDLLLDDVGSLAKRLRDGLDAAEIRERSVAVALPAGWAFAVSTALPDLPPEDLEGFVELEAERGFPYGPDQLSILRSEWAGVDGLPQLTLMAVPQDKIARLEAVLRAARLQPVSLSPALVDLQELTGTPASTRVDLAPAGTELGLVVASGSGIVLSRAIEGALVREGDAVTVVSDLLGRELRVTLGQLPAATLGALKSIRVIGTGSVADQVAAGIQVRAAAMGLSVERIDRTQPGLPASPKLAPGMALEAALAVAVRQASGRAAAFEFLPPRVSAWQQFASRYSSGKLVHAAMAAGAVAVLVLGAFGVQQARLMALGNEWNSIAKDVRHVEDWQGQVKKFRPWFDVSVKSLMALKTLTEAFPEDGAVTAKTVEIRDQGVVVCSGTAKDQPSLLRMLDKLRRAKEVSAVQVDQLRGKSPLQFSFNFRWDAAGRQP